MWLVVAGFSRAASVGFLRLATLFLAYGMPAVIAAKLALVVLVGALSVAASTQRSGRVWSVVGGLPLAIAIAFGLIGGITNAATFLA